MRRFLTILLVWLFGATLAAAHEVQPAIADLETENGQLTLFIALNAEPIVAGVDLEGVEDTNDTDRSDEVDRLRALEPDALEAALRDALPQIAEALNVRTPDAPVTLEATEITVAPIGNVDLPRETGILWQGALPAGADQLFVDWPAEYGTLILRQQGVEEPYTGYLTGGEGSGPIQIEGGDAQSGWQAFFGYIPVGFDHILPLGLDHILFVLGLFFLSTHLRPLLWQVSAFTLAHTVTLALGALGMVNIPGSIVEPLIAASITFVAVENILSRGLSRARPVVVFVFGLLHGLGFASVLGEFGLPQQAFVPALIGFNVGVELGQLTVIALAALLVWLAVAVDRGDADSEKARVVYAVLAVVFVALGLALNGDGFTAVMGSSAPVFLWPLAALAGLCFLSATFVDRLDAYRNFVAIPASAAIGLVGAWWFVERVFL
ncbi:HupE/UreJ family protein [Aestuariicoccus sp. MJ-SS9]|uniref:HupE/UreJ family protein n=1 Tax=Aestuariicoccus sp. MJ-SS9 TaxID=3079855 RepID=UPI002913836F|nr:HupE/UreJ family protein [Aestuariicoccus sp. MJ-SS9]MDU8912085.1 HupE/UreJ family protein [Aestuariicoccus sp. MJ-SS9]